jgi:hypothetical protein
MDAGTDIGAPSGRIIGAIGIGVTAFRRCTGIYLAKTWQTSNSRRAGASFALDDADRQHRGSKGQLRLPCRLPVIGASNELLCAISCGDQHRAIGSRGAEPGFGRGNGRRLGLAETHIEAFLLDDMQARLTKVAAEQATARSRARRERDATASLLRTAWARMKPADDGHGGHLRGSTRATLVAFD